VKIFTGARVLALTMAVIGVTTVLSRAADKFGEEIVNRDKLTAVDDILADPKAYEGKTVTIDGMINMECPSGCFFYLAVAGTNAAILVDLKPAGLAIPQKVGRRVLVEGTVAIKDNLPVLFGKGVEIR
jgi:hypothetical protein